MAFDDLPLDRPVLRPDPEPTPVRPSFVQWIVVGLAGVLAGALLMFWWMSRAQPTPAAPPSPPALDAATRSSRPMRQAIDLPALDDSDTLLRDLVAALSKHPTLARLLATTGLARGVTLAVVQVGDGRTPIEPLKVLRPSSRLQLSSPSGGHVDPQSYRRWDNSVGALVSVAPNDAAQLYVNVKPLIDQAYIELGHSGEDFDAAIVRAIEMLESTPEPTTDPVILKRPGYYEYEDPAFRALRPVQKQWLLLGPEQRRRLISWFKSFASTLELKIR